MRRGRRIRRDWWRQLRRLGIRPKGRWRGLLSVRTSPEPDLPARYRALKRLAVQAHDHEREQEYFAGELKALRGNPDRWWKPWTRGGIRYLVGLVYQGLSDFGHSMIRPVVWWVASLAAFAWLYHGGHGVRPGAAEAGTCVAGPGEAWSSALLLSLHKALPISGLGAGGDKLSQIHACLYGIHGVEEPLTALPARFVPVIPDWVAALGIVQLLFSLLLIFLFVLAVRNHFRIR